MNYLYIGIFYCILFSLYLFVQAGQMDIGKSIFYFIYIVYYFFMPAKKEEKSNRCFFSTTLFMGLKIMFVIISEKLSFVNINRHYNSSALYP